MKQIMLGILAAISLVNISLASAVEVQLIAKNIDDRVDIYVDGDNVATCTWNMENCQAYRKLNLTGKHKINFKLTNYVYKGFCLFGRCGKYSGDFAIALGDGRALWSDAIYVRDNTKGVKYDKKLVCVFDEDDSYCVEER